MHHSPRPLSLFWIDTSPIIHSTLPFGQVVFGVHLHRLLDALLGRFRPQKLVDAHFFVLVLFVVFKKAANLVQAVHGQFGDVVEAAVLGVVGVDGDDLVVALAL